MESERAQNFNDRLNQWIAGQGFWFQLKYSMTGKKGMAGAGGYHILRLAFRTLCFLLILGVAAVLYLIKLPNTEGFGKKMESSISGVMRAKEAAVRGFSREQGKMSINRLAAIGREDAFYTDFDARNISCRMGLLDSVRTLWKTEGVSISELRMNLRAGAGDASNAERLGDVLFNALPGVEINTIDVERATVSWGFSELAKGRIEGSQLKIRRRDDGWWIQFKGGKFSQNWLKDLDVEELVMVSARDGLTIEKGYLRRGAGSVDLSGTTVIGAERPQVKGTMKLKSVPLANMLPGTAGSLVDGAVSGELKLSGSTNSQEGIGMEGRMVIGEADKLVLRERIPLLRALRMVDSFNNYRLVRFESGSFKLKTGEGKLEVEELDLKAGELMTLKGSMIARPPTKEEREKVVERPLSDSPLGIEPLPPATEDKGEFSLKRAAEESRKKTADDARAGLVERYEASVGEREFTSRMAEKLTESLRYEGALEITLRPDAFDQTPQLKALHQVDEGTGRIFLTVPLSGTLDSLTFSQAEEIYGKGKR